MIRSIYNEIYGEIEAKENFTKLGITLSRIVDKSPAWSYNYIRNVYHGNQPASKQLIKAINIYGAMIDGQSELQAKARAVTMYTVNGINGNSFIIGLHERDCPHCGLTFIGPPQQIYCTPKHGRAYRRDQREQCSEAYDSYQALNAHKRKHKPVAISQNGKGE